jgi:rsbT co-antagonist protein RsbR
MLQRPFGATARKGFTPSEATTFVFSFKQPLFKRLQMEVGENMKEFSDEIWTATLLLDQLGLYMTEVFQKSREDVIRRQQDEMLELSTPVVKLWDGILALKDGYTTGDGLGIGLGGARRQARWPRPGD